MEKLIRLRIYFFIYFAARLILDITYGKIFIHDTIDQAIPSGTDSFLLSPVMLNIFIVFIYVLMFGLGMLIFNFLVKKRNWARIVLLIAGWLMVVDAVTGVVFQRQISGLLGQISREVDWRPLLSLDRLSDLLGLIFAGILIYTLQFRNEVKKLFLEG